MQWFSDTPPAALAGLFLASAIGILFAGVRLTRIAEDLAEETGLGQAITGGFFLGATTSLPGLIASATAAYAGYPRLAVANAVGGIAAQTAFLAIADLSCPKVNLEHVAASLANIMQGVLLVGLLALILLASNLPEWSFFHIHPISVLMVGAYYYGMHLSSKTLAAPMWRPQQTRETQDESREEHHGSENWMRLLPAFLGFGAVVVLGGWLLAQAGIASVNRLGMKESYVGGILTAVCSSLPELVTSIVAVRRGAYTLAVGGIIGGNAFDTLFVAVADVAYRDGSIYHAIDQAQTFLIALTILMTAVLILGLVSREKKGIANIGFESFGILLLYGVGAAVMILGRSPNSRPEAFRAAAIISRLN